MNPYYDDDLVTLYLGDARELGHWTTADVLITDPPYGIAYDSGMVPGRSRPIDGDNDTTVRDTVLDIWGDKPWAMFGTWRARRPPGIQQILVWDKTEGTGPGMGNLTRAFGTSHEEIYLGGDWPKRAARRGSVLRTTGAMGNPYGLVARMDHPTPKPVDLMEVLIGASSGTVADPFAGSGSTLVAAKRLRRKAIGVEIVERYCETAAKRLAQGVLEIEEAFPF